MHSSNHFLKPPESVRIATPCNKFHGLTVLLENYIKRGNKSHIHSSVNGMLALFDKLFACDVICIKKGTIADSIQGAKCLNVLSTSSYVKPDCWGKHSRKMGRWLMSPK